MDAGLHKGNGAKQRWYFHRMRPVMLALLVASLACALPTVKVPQIKSAPTAVPSAALPGVVSTPTRPAVEATQTQATGFPAADEPPLLVEVQPPPGSDLSQQSSLVFYFNMPMDQESVQRSTQIQPQVESKFEWQDPSILRISIDGVALPPETSLSVIFNNNARSAMGKFLAEPVEVRYQTPPALQTTERLPRPGVTNADPSATVAATFSRPVVPLVGEVASLPPGFTLEPAAQGRGEWLNTSTYVFYPQPALAGGRTYTARLNASLGLDDSQSWSFTTAVPAVLKVEPDFFKPVWLDAPIVVTFNQPMDAASVQENFLLQKEDEARIAGSFSWNDDFTRVTFQPEPGLDRETTYFLAIATGAHDQGGTPLARKIEAQFTTVNPLAVQQTTPSAGELLEVFETGYASIQVDFTSPLAQQDMTALVSFSPPVADLSTYLPPDSETFTLWGYFEPSTTYTLTLSSGIKDRWGQPLGSAVDLTFITGPAAPSFHIPMLQVGSLVLFATTAETTIPARAANIQSLDILAGNLNPADLIAFMQDPQNAPLPAQYNTWKQPLELVEDKNQPVEVNLTAAGSALTPGIYYYSITSSQVSNPNINGTRPFVLVVSDIHLLLKRSETSMFLWAYDLKRKVPAARLAVDFYDNRGSLLGSAVTDEQGVAQLDMPIDTDPYNPVYASAGKPGDANFSLAGTIWNQSLTGWEYSLPVDLNSSRDRFYLYTDRPIYRPGQRVYFRGIARAAANARYSLLDRPQTPVRVMGISEMGEPPVIYSQELDLSSFGTFAGEFDLPTDAPPGYYTLQVGDPVETQLGFQVAEYRKPEIELQVDMVAEQTASQNLTASVRVSYYFGAPAGRLPVTWTLRGQRSYFSLPDRFQTGKPDDSWLLPPGSGEDMPGGRLIAQGEGQTAADGTLTITVPADTLKQNIDTQVIQRLTLEVTTQDESQQPVSARGQTTLHPADFYIGVRPASWSAVAEQEIGFDVQIVDWQRNPSGEHALRAVFRRVVWKQDISSPAVMSYPRLTPEYTEVGSADFRTDAAGRARLAFIPDQPGTYQLEVGGGGAVTVVEVWAGGIGNAAWPQLPNARLKLSADADSYKPGETAKVLIPNPFPQGAQALITVERGMVMRWQVLQIEGASASFDLPLKEEDAPNIYLSVTLLNQGTEGGLDFRQGFLELEVSPAQEILQVQVAASPENAAPGQEVSLALQVKDAQGQPVEGEFSLALVDKAVLALADPNAPDIVEAFYGRQPLGVSTSMSSAAYIGRMASAPPGGRGGGPGEASPYVREQFADTALWNPQVKTDASGAAVVIARLPDNLTTWVLDVRGLTVDTRVGSAASELVTSKDLLVRPSLPRFLVAGDHVELAAVVNNNTASPLQVDVSLQAEGVTLDQPHQAAVRVEIPAHDRRRVTWPARVETVDRANLLFTARSGTLEDTIRPEQGALPVLRYTVRQTFATAGTLADAGLRTEWISLPRSFNPEGGELRIELAPSLAATVVQGLKALDTFPTDFSEAALSRLLANLEAYQALQKLGVDAPDLKTALDQAVQEDLRTLGQLQNQEGSWGWLSGSNGDSYITAYILFGLSRVQGAGIDLPDEMADKAAAYLAANTGQPEAQMETWQLDRLLFQSFALQQAGQPANLDAWFAYSERLSPWANAFLAVMQYQVDPSNSRAGDLLSRLESSAERSASGARWTGASPQFRNYATPTFSTAAVVYALARLDPASPLLVEGVRYLASVRQPSGGWYSSYDTAWSLIALTEALQGTGDLQARYDFAASLNGTQIANGSVSGSGDLTPVQVKATLEQLNAQTANQLQISRDEGVGRLYYRAFLQVDRPAREAPAVERGLSVSRRYQLAGQDCRTQDCSSLTSARLAAPAPVVEARLTVTVPADLTNVVVEDYIPAGSEILNTALKTSQQQGISQVLEAEYNPRDPFARGWGWWYFHEPQIYDDHIRWFADTLPAGAYQLTYRLVLTHTGEYQVLPARAYAYYFPEIQGSSAGEVFNIQP